MKLRTAASVIIILLAGSTLPAQTKSPPLQVDDVLVINSKKDLLDLSLTKAEALADLMSRVQNDDTAQDLRPEMERLYLEWAMVTVRLGMMGPPTKADVQMISAAAPRYQQVCQSLQREGKRISQSHSMTMTLQSVMLPLAQQIGGQEASLSRSLISQLQTLRSQIELYKLQHNDQLPDFRHHGWKQFTSKTDSAGNIKDGSPFGPYLISPPQNALASNNSRILLVHRPPSPAFTYTKGDCGFVIDERTGRIWGLDSSGKIFDENAAAPSGTAARAE